MKREGRQHGMVRTISALPSPLNPKPESRTKTFNRFDSPPTAGSFTKVSNKPTNHSKFTGKHEPAKWSESHVAPTCRYKEKSKGTEKTLRFSGASASEILETMFFNRVDYEYYDDEVCDVVYSDHEDVNWIGFSEVGFLVLDDDDKVDDDDDWCLVQELDLGVRS